MSVLEVKVCCLLLARYDLIFILVVGDVALLLGSLLIVSRWYACSRLGRGISCDSIYPVKLDLVLRAKQSEMVLYALVVDAVELCNS